jgi:hypothetical protein
MIYTYMGICVLMIPVLITYSTGDGKESYGTLGNIGFVEPQCYWQMLDSELMV